MNSFVYFAYFQC
uniref:Uncharacterized protein n=1 Tax=Rhizophora mucronata TaxID=61149 RepID=A0A2P2PYM2_RHIMU